MRLSVLDQSPISEGSTGAAALRNSVEVARLADSLGFQRYWVAEHHGTPALACAAPEILIAAIAAANHAFRSKHKQQQQGDEPRRAAVVGYSD